MAAARQQLWGWEVYVQSDRTPERLRWSIDCEVFGDLEDLGDVDCMLRLQQKRLKLLLEEVARGQGAHAHQVQVRLYFSLDDDDWVPYSQLGRDSFSVLQDGTSLECRVVAKGAHVTG